ncbi:alpha/beta fold hydrolase [Halarcobacter sp.]|uniref:alpha/beta fold hydrolase n=1 Tax=Halarcobacter sp. TaxID=2321133 RepID=UPI002AA6E191|nr:alpha/beta fold hydrolase [Halarcobacter sp.]
MKEIIYLIPGLMTDKRLWSRLIPHLEDEYELIHFQIPLSEDFDEIIEDLDREIGNKKVNILGFSLGGYIASYYTLKNPEKIKRLFLVSSTPSSTEEKDIARREKKLQEAREDNFTPLNLEKAKELLEIKDDEELIHIVSSMFNDLGNKAFVPQLATTLKREDLFDDLVKLNIPIGLYYSTEDRLLNHTSINEILQKENRLKVVAREGTSHNIPLEFSKELSLHIKNWMTHE